MCLSIFDSILITNYIFSLLHTEIGIDNKIINSFYDWITTYFEPLSEEEVDRYNVLIALQVGQAHNKQKFEKWTEKNCTIIHEFKIGKKLIDSLLKEKNDDKRII